MISMSKQMTADSEIVAADGLRSPPQFGMSNSRANSMRMECGCSLRLQYRVPHFNGGGRVRKSLQELICASSSAVMISSV